MRNEIEKACAGAITHAVEKSQSALTPVQSMLLIMSVFAIGLIIWLGPWYLSKLEERLSKSTKLCEAMVDEHRQYTAELMAALNNPCAKVTFTFSAPSTLERTGISETVMVKGGKA